MYVNETQIYSFSPDPAEIISVNLMAIVEQHIFTQQEFARAASETKQLVKGACTISMPTFSQFQSASGGLEGLTPHHLDLSPGAKDLNRDPEILNQYIFKSCHNARASLMPALLNGPKIDDPLE